MTTGAPGSTARLWRRRQAAEIWRTFELHQTDPDWCLASKLDDNPLAWLITVNGFAMGRAVRPA